jgi:hypothetical protein
MGMYRGATVVLGSPPITGDVDGAGDDLVAHRAETKL